MSDTPEKDPNPNYPISPTSETRDPYEEVPVLTGIGYHDPDATELDKDPFYDTRGAE